MGLQKRLSLGKSNQVISDLRYLLYGKSDDMGDIGVIYDGLSQQHTSQTSMQMDFE